MRPVDIPGPTLPLNIWSHFFFKYGGAALGVVWRYWDDSSLFTLKRRAVVDAQYNAVFRIGIAVSRLPRRTCRLLWDGQDTEYTLLPSGEKFGKHDICHRFSIGFQWSRACVSSRLVSGPLLSSGRLASFFGHILRLLSNQTSRSDVGQTQTQIEF